jgi:OOP family OmpA-OmpF porin
MTSGYHTATPSPYVIDLGVRYMFNNKFGLKLISVTIVFKVKIVLKIFDTTIELTQAVANLGRIMNFETWTNQLVY